MAFTHETKPKMKKSKPIIKIEMMVSFFVRELTSTAAARVLLMKGNYFTVIVETVFSESNNAERLSR